MKGDNLPKKSLGQHWLNDEISLLAMCDFANVSKTDTVLEIGPGQGSLTKKLVERAGQVIAVEFDQSLAKSLTQSLGFATNLQIVSEDILKFDLTKLLKGYKVVANIPYYLTSNLLRVLCESTNPFITAALLVQKEVALRVTAKPGAMSLLSVSVQYYCVAELGQVVSAELFEPAPKVDSQILILTRRTNPTFTGWYPTREELSEFFRVVKAGFSERRKKLRSSLSGGLRISKPEAEVLLKSAGIDPNLRAQDLSMQDWYNLFVSYGK